MLDYRKGLGKDHIYTHNVPIGSRYLTIQLSLREPDLHHYVHRPLHMASQSHVHITHCAKLTKTYLLQDTESHVTFMTTGEGQVQLLPLLYIVVVDWSMPCIYFIFPAKVTSRVGAIAR